MVEKTQSIIINSHVPKIIISTKKLVAIHFKSELILEFWLNMTGCLTGFLLPPEILENEIKE
jgi:hypothetical protein